MKTGLEMKRRHSKLSVNMVNWHECRWKCRQTTADRLHMRIGFFAKMIEQTLMTSRGDVKRTSHA